MQIHHLFETCLFGFAHNSQQERACHHGQERCEHSHIRYGQIKYHWHETLHFRDIRRLREITNGTTDRSNRGVPFGYLKEASVLTGWAVTSAARRKRQMKEAANEKLLFFDPRFLGGNNRLSQSERSQSLCPFAQRLSLSPIFGPRLFALAGLLLFFE